MLQAVVRKSFSLSDESIAAEPTVDKDDRKNKKDEQEVRKCKPETSSRMTRQTTRRLQRAGVITEFYPSLGDASQKDRNYEQLEDIESDDYQDHEVAPLKRKVRPESPTKSKADREHGKSKADYTVMSAYLDYYGFEESDEAVEPLTNKRTERRKKQKLVNDNAVNAQGNELPDPAPCQAKKFSSIEDAEPTEFLVYQRNCKKWDPAALPEDKMELPAKNQGHGENTEATFPSTQQVREEHVDISDG